MLGSMALIISLSVLDGFDKKLRETAVKFTSHVSLRTFNRKLINDWNQTIDYIKNYFPEVSAAAPLIEREGLLRRGKSVEGILIRSLSSQMQPGNNNQKSSNYYTRTSSKLINTDITGISKTIIKGKTFSPEDSTYSVIISEKLALRIDAELGDSLVIYTLKKETIENIPEPQIDKFKITGIYKTGMVQYDETVVFIPFQTATNFFSLPKNASTSIEIILKDLNQADKVGEAIQKQMGYPYVCFSVFELHRAIFSWIDLQKEPIPLVLGLISIVAVFNIITTLLITVVEKTHFIGILSSLGMKSRTILFSFITQGLKIGITGSLSGCALAFTFGWLQNTFEFIKLRGEIYYLDSLPIKFSLWHFELVAGISILLTIAASAVPALIASRVRPLRAIRFKM